MHNAHTNTLANKCNDIVVEYGWFIWFLSSQMLYWLSAWIDFILVICFRASICVLRTCMSLYLFAVHATGKTIVRLEWSASSQLLPHYCRSHFKRISLSHQMQVLSKDQKRPKVSHLSSWSQIAWFYPVMYIVKMLSVSSCDMNPKNMNFLHMLFWLTDWPFCGYRERLSFDLFSLNRCRADSS